MAGDGDLPHDLERLLSSMQTVTETMKRQVREVESSNNMKNFYLQLLWALVVQKGGQVEIPTVDFAAMESSDMVSVIFSTDQTKIVVSAARTDAPPAGTSAH